MKKYILLYKGPLTPPDASHTGWPEWFQGIGDSLVDKGSPMIHGLAFSQGTSHAIAPTNLNGYSIIQVEDEDEVHQLVRNHPYLLNGDQYVIEAFQLPAK